MLNSNYCTYLLVFCIFMLGITFGSLRADAQTDTEFWFTAPEASDNHGDRPVFIRISTTDQPAGINLRMPANPAFQPVKANIPANTTYSIRLDEIEGNNTWLDSIENRPPNTVLRKGFQLTSDQYITAYYEINNASNPAIFPFKGKNALGTDFYISGQTHYANQTNCGSEAFDIVATRDTTIITIIPSIDIEGHPAHQPFQVILNRGETYSARTFNTSAAASLAGSRVTSDKPIAITISDDSILTGGWDIIGDQIVPVNLLGWEYIAIKGYADNSPPGNNDERLYITATQDGTEVWIDGGGVAVATLNAGEQFSHAIMPDATTALIRTSKPAYIYHLTGHPGEAGASILPHDSCTGSRKVGFNRSTNNAFAMMILTRTGNEGAFLLNGNNALITAPEFLPVPGSNGNWVYFRQNNMPVSEVPLGANILENTTGKFHLGILNNVGASSEYGFFSDFSTLYLGADASLCPGDSLILDGGPFRDSYEWKKLTNGNWTLMGIQQFFTCYDTGYYACQTNGDFCTLYDTIHVQYYPNASVYLGDDQNICEGSLITLNPGTYQSYEWSDGSTGPFFTTGAEDLVWVRVTNNDGCVASDTVMISVDSLPFANQPVTGPGHVCEGSTGNLYQISPLPYATSYQWTTPPGFTGTSSTSSILLESGLGSVSGQLSVKGVNFCGTGQEISFDISVDPLPSPPAGLIIPPSICQGETGVILSVHPSANATGYFWQLPPGLTLTSAQGQTITVNAAVSATPGTIFVRGTNQCGDGEDISDSIEIAPLPDNPGLVSGPADVCQGNTAVSYLVSGYDPVITSFEWEIIPPNAGNVSGNTSTVQVDWNPSFDGAAQLRVKGLNNCGSGPWSMPFEVLAHTQPIVSYQACHDLFTTKNARPVRLRGGLPAGSGGWFSGPGVSEDTTGQWFFHPTDENVTGSPGGTPVPIKYMYTDAHGCSGEAIRIIKVYPSTSGQPCTGKMTDVRDGKQYEVFASGNGSMARCWMSENLNYGTMVPFQQSQTENCLPEKYCIGDEETNCQSAGGFYQWGEVMDYATLPGSQGICPPGWHIPDQNDWHSLLVAMVPEGTQPVDGIAGSILKDLSPMAGFHALLKGVGYLNSQWSYGDGFLTGTMYWTSGMTAGLRPIARGLSGKAPSVSFYAGHTGNAMNVRCIRD